MISVEENEKMQGFFVSNIVSDYKIIENNSKSFFQFDELSYDEYIIQRHTPQKFIDDKVFVEKDKFIFLIEGVVLEKRNWISKNGEKMFADALSKIMEAEGNLDSFVAPGFSLAVYDKIKGMWLFYANQINDKGVFYYIDKESGKFIVASSVKYITDYLNMLNLSYSLCVESVQDLLTFGYNVRNYGCNTCVYEIKRIPAGHKLIVDENAKTYTMIRYHEFKQGNYDTISEKEAVETIENLFRKNVMLAADKNKEYGYRQLTSLSGGLDSRMTTWVLNELGYDDIIALTFAQSGNTDQTVAQQIASDLRIEWLFKSLDDAGFIANIPEKIQEVDGLCEVSGTIHEDSILRRLDFSELGILHTGQLGDVVLGTFWNNNINCNIYEKAYSQLLFDRIKMAVSFEDYDNEELFFFYTRGFLGALCPQLSLARYSEPISPFCSVELMEFMFSLPKEWRMEHRIYKKWILERHPSAANYIWEKTGTKINSSRAKMFIEKVKSVGLTNIPQVLKYKLGFSRRLILKNNKMGMNPYDYWYETNPKVRETLLELYMTGMEKIIIEDDMRKLIATLYNEGNCREKVQAVSAIYAIDCFFGEGIKYDTSYISV